MRSELLLGKETMKRLDDAHILICGLGGVGSFVAEGLFRTGVNHMTLVDFDVVEYSNFNRQLEATKDTVGWEKTLAMKGRLEAISPKSSIQTISLRLDNYNMAYLFENEKYDYVVDAMDNVPAKLALARVAAAKKIPFISSMGCGNKLSPQSLSIVPISQTKMCPLARAVRKRAKKLQIDFPVCYSQEIPVKRTDFNEPVGSVIFVPGVAGLMIGGYVVEHFMHK